MQDREDADAALLHLACVVALGGLLTLAWRSCHARHQHRRTSRSARPPAPVDRWEGEGGRPLPPEHEASSAATAKPA
ncbi:hypothetical protein ASD35_15275 [Pelomonas sp. Root1444]|nr:hypothetical protein ASD35_15275 [Pelomonas sp. Root1444]